MQYFIPDTIDEETKAQYTKQFDQVPAAGHAGALLDQAPFISCPNSHNKERAESC